MTQSTWEIGNQIASIDDPGRNGIIVAGPRLRSDGLLYRVKWIDGQVSWTHESQIESIENPKDIYTLLETKRFGLIKELRRNLTFVQLKGRLANVVYSMDTTNTEFYAYQYKPVLTFLESPTNGILIADEVGLGKTIEAGLIWTELRARHDARRLVVVCPAVLRDKWINELSTKFGVEAQSLNATELARELRRDRYSIPDGRGYVCSLQGIRPPSRWREDNSQSSRAELAHTIEEISSLAPAIDLLVIDEAHYLRNPSTQSAELGELLREVSEHIVLLSATPINNQSRDLYQLLRLVDSDSFSDEKQFPLVLQANEPLIRARNLALSRDSKEDEIKKELRTAQHHPLLSQNQQLRGLLNVEMGQEYLRETASRVDLANRIERINLLRHTVNRTRKSEVQEWRVVRDARSHFVDLDSEGPERDFYEAVTRSIRSYASQEGIGDGFLLSTPQRQMSSSMYAAARSWKDRAYSKEMAEQLYEDLGTLDTPQPNVGPLLRHIAKEVLPTLDIEALRRHDTKYEEFKVAVSKYLSDHPNEKIIVFSYFKATLSYLHGRLSALGISTQLLHGDTRENKQSAIERFRDSRDTRVLLTSEVSSEGVDLQFCSLVVNYDMPWNPMKIEQRIGRIDRIGQRAEKVLIYTMGHNDTIDARIYELLLRKLEIFEHALGGLEVVLGEKISELTNFLMSHELTPEQEAKRIQQTYTAIENTRQQQDELEKKAKHLIAHGGYILDRVRKAHQFSRRITGRDLKTFVRDYLDHYVKGFEFREDDRNPLRVSMRLPPAFVVHLQDYMQKQNVSSSGYLIRGERVVCEFRNKIEPSTSRREVINQFHPLVRFISSDLSERAMAFHPLVAAQVSQKETEGLERGTYAFVCKLWKFEGLRSEELLQARALPLSGDSQLLDSDQSWSLVNATRVEGHEWLAVSNEVAIDQVECAFSDCEIQLQLDYKTAKFDRTNENTDRVQFQELTTTRNRERLVEKQKELLERYRADGRQQLIPMTEGRINSISNRFEIDLERLQLKKQTTSSESDVCWGVVKVF